METPFTGGQLSSSHLLPQADTHVFRHWVIHIEARRAAGSAGKYRKNKCNL